MAKFKNGSNLEFTDISNNETRVYVFENKNIEISKPLYLNVSKSGGHRIFDAQGISHYIPSGWVHLYWKAKKGKPNFVR